MAYRVLLRLIRPTAAAAAVPIAKELGPRAAQRLDLTTNPPSDLGQERRVAVGLLVGVNGRIAAQLGSKVTPGPTSQATAGTTPQTGPSVIPEMSAWTTLTAANVPFLEYLWRRGLPDLPYYGSGGVSPSFKRCVPLTLLQVTAEAAKRAVVTVSGPFKLRLERQVL